MEKRKAKREVPDNAPDWLEPLLLKRPLVHDIDAPLPMVSNALHELDIPSTSLFQQQARSVTVETDTLDTVTFTVEAKRRARTIYTVSAIARGVLSGDGEVTHLRGYVRLSLVGIAGLATPMVLSFVIVLWLVGTFWMRVMLTIPLLMAFMLAAVVGYAWWRLTQMRQDLEMIVDDLAGVVSRQQLKDKRKQNT